MPQMMMYKPLPTTTFLGLFLLILAGISNYLHLQSLQEQLESSIVAQSIMIADNIAPALQFRDDAAARNMLHSLASNPDITSVLVMDQQAQIFAGWLKHQGQQYAIDQAPIPVYAREVDKRMTIPIMMGHHLGGEVTVDYSRNGLRKKTLTSALGSVVVILLMMLVAYVLLKRIHFVQQSKQKIEADHRQTRDSIEYASLIQNAFIPDASDFDRYFSEHFCFWKPKDIVGGDIYTLIPLRHEDEVLLMVIDCTGHGVPGAFVSMLVKAIEQQIVTKLLHQQDDISPAHILTTFNQSLKTLLKQNSAQLVQDDDVLHTGFDGGILYYDKRRAIVRFAGANLPLFYVHQGEVRSIKGDRHSVGYFASDMNYHFTEHQLSVVSGMCFYLTTDGYLDQNGGEKGFPLGKRRFVQTLTQHQHATFGQQAQVLINLLANFQKNYEQTDDITLIGVKI